MCYYYSSSGRHSLRRIISVVFIVLSALDNVSNEQSVKDQEGLVECHQCFTHCKTLASNRFDTSNCECGDDGDMTRSGDYSGDINVLLSNNNDAHRIRGGGAEAAAAAAAQSVSKNKCLAKACFAKIEIFTHEKTAILQVKIS
ncbi:unnamed protein product [Anisakis simplex]|uniref:Secreted protein n=1 Tax=Anisakis simplex TaxID=6269 RepID=A0A0M3IYH5_ANISI|nr:unnamed protein product [Anisakis simplex]